MISVSKRPNLLVRWFDLTRRVLPAMAVAHAWPVRADHCFMRICLDVSLGQAWPSVVRAPAVRHLSDLQLAAAVRVAESIVSEPNTLVAQNGRSLALRRVWRRKPGCNTKAREGRDLTTP